MFDMVENIPTGDSSTHKGKPAQILVIEDESEIRELISLILLRQGYAVQQCASAVEAMSRLKNEQFDLMILDWMLPQMSGIELLKTQENKVNHCPVLMVTAKSEPQDIVAGLEAGADDYLSKPFESVVLTARVKALLRRFNRESAPSATSEKIVMGDLNINLATYEVFCAGEQLHLTPSEYKILTTMCTNIGRVLTRDHLISIVQGDGISVTGRTIDTHVFGLRKKLDSCADMIETIRGVGYRIKSLE
jgi:two-component system phosphate regulon response regulator PhoB